MNAPRDLLALALAICLAACGTPPDDGDGNGDGGADAGTDESACDAARDAASTAYQALDRSCTQASDCEFRSIGGCGCPIPIAKSANDSAFRSAKGDAQDACGEGYSGPGAQSCLNAVVCEYGSGDGATVPLVCNDGVCDQDDTF